MYHGIRIRHHTCASNFQARVYNYQASLREICRVSPLLPDRIHVALSPERRKMDDFRPHLPGSDGHLPVQADVVAQLQAFVQDREAFSDNTWRQLLSVMRICAGWANEHRPHLSAYGARLSARLPVVAAGKRSCIFDNQCTPGFNWYVTP